MMPLRVGRRAAVWLIVAVVIAGAPDRVSAQEPTPAAEAPRSGSTFDVQGHIFNGTDRKSVV